ncbi:MAG: ANT(4')-I family aminoglycoside nucleotidyltransferase [Bacillota bacterium]
MQQPMSREARLALAHRIAQHARNAYSDKLKAIGLYGSTARGTDGPYSDIEIFCVLRSRGEEFSYEWVAGPWKAEVDFYSEEILLTKAARVEGRWPLTHGAFTHVLPLWDPEDFFEELRAAAASPPEADFHLAVEGMLVGELYEFAGKWRNAEARGETSHLPALAVETARYGALLLGLHHRRTYSTGSKLLEEALALPDRPDGFDPLCQRVMAGQLSDPKAVLEGLVRFWEGVQAWAAAHGYAIKSEQEIPF